MNRLERLAPVMRALAGCTLLAGALSGCAAEDAAGLAEPLPVMKAEGALQTKIDNKDIALDLSSMQVTVDVLHRVNKDAKGLACVPSVFVTAQNGDGTCKLELDFKAGFEGEGLLLNTARFHAKLGLKQDGKVIDTKPCAGWTTEKANGEVVYQKSAGEGKLAFAPLQAPFAGMAKATLKQVVLQPQGEITMKFLGRKFQLDLGKLKFKGDIASQGSESVACVKTFHDFPSWELPDIQPVSPMTGQSYGLSQFKGKRVVVMMGAGWCGSCIAQGKSMEKIQKSLKASGRDDFQMVTINDASASSAANQKAMTDTCTFPVFQGPWNVHVGMTNEGKSWPGKKNDAFIYGKNGRQLFYFKGTDPVNTTDFEQQITKYLTAKEDVSYADELTAAEGTAP